MPSVHRHNGSLCFIHIIEGNNYRFRGGWRRTDSHGNGTQVITLSHSFVTFGTPFVASNLVVFGLFRRFIIIWGREEKGGRAATKLFRWHIFSWSPDGYRRVQRILGGHDLVRADIIVLVAWLLKQRGYRLPKIQDIIIDSQDLTQDTEIEFSKWTWKMCCNFKMAFWSTTLNAFCFCLCLCRIT